MQASQELQNNFSKGGIYVIKNSSNNKKYIGSTKNFRKRFSQHLSKLNIGNHNNVYLLNAYTKDKNMFFMDVVEILNDFNNMRKIEKDYIKNLNLCDKNYGYNLTFNTECCSKDNNVRKKISKTIKQNMLKEISLTGKWILDDYKFLKGSIPWNKGSKILNTENFHTKKTITNKVLESRKKTAIQKKESGLVIACIDKNGIEKFVFRSLQDVNDLVNYDSSYGFTIALSNLSKAIKNEKLYKGYYFIKRVPNESDFIRKSDELLET